MSCFINNLFLYLISMIENMMIAVNFYTAKVINFHAFDRS